MLQLLFAGAARNAIDSALWALEGKAAGQTLVEYAGVALPLTPQASFIDLDSSTWLAIDAEPALSFQCGVDNARLSAWQAVRLDRGGARRLPSDARCVVGVR